MKDNRDLAQQQTQQAQQSMPEMLASFSMTKQEIAALRLQRLRALLAHAKENSTWYKDKLRHIDVNTFTLEQMPELPTLDKATLMDNWDAIVTRDDLNLNVAEKHLEKIRDDDEALFLLDNYHVIASGGSSGRRGIIAYDWNEWITYYLTYRRFPYKEGVLPNKKVLQWAMVGAQKATHATYSIAKTFIYPHLNTHILPITLPMADIVSTLNDVQPDILQGYTSTVYQLTLEAKKGRLQINPAVVRLGSEPCYDFIKQEILATWPQTAFFNTFGSSEGLAAIQCEAGSETLHLNDDFCVVEPVDRQGQPVAYGETSAKLFMTNLFNFTLPLIRFEMNDEFKFVEQACQCGVKLQLVEEPKGRAEYNFTYADDLYVHHYAFLTYLLHDEHIQEYQVMQTKDGADIAIVSNGVVDKQKVIEGIYNELMQLGLKDPAITLREVSGFDYPETGKLRRFVPLK